MSKVKIRTRNAEFEAELDDSDVSNSIWLSKQVTLDINMIGGMIYSELPLDVVVPKGDCITKLEKGDVAYWPGPGAFCIFYGPTPLSGEDGNPVSPYPVIKIGKMIGDCSELENAGDRQRLVIEPTF